MSTKPSNPKDALGVRKTPFSTVPAPVIAELGVAMLEGALKYGRHNYRVIGVRASVYYDAVLRHMADWWEGEDIDRDSGLHAVTKAIASLVVLRDAIMRDNWVDDRPPIAPRAWLEGLNERVASLIERFPNPPEPYTQHGITAKACEPERPHVICGFNLGLDNCLFCNAKWTAGSDDRPSECKHRLNRKAA